jgi:hypothetical protein
MVDNPIHRYSVGGRSNLVPNADGSVGPRVFCLVARGYRRLGGHAFAHPLRTATVRLPRRLQLRHGV